MKLSRRKVLKMSGVTLSALAGCNAPSADTSGESPTDTPTSSPTATPSPTTEATPTPTSTPTPNALDGEITVKGSEWVLEPDAFQGKVDQELTIHFENVGEVAHNLSVGEFPADERPVAEQDEAGTFIVKTDTIQPDETTSVVFTPESTGTFPYWCDVPGHREAGMVGEMTVTE
ncbi:copper-binding protein (plasmid) [Haloferax mediterranei ATCC 33500]|uniref:Copper binding protein, plastocyanin/azurin family n=1 Tax=Haloferax mediterranei (strain ATCC 33500 / DSM 1411 / JCM 8866 / NBRC 14739 / NCIMB 2177 / R-4) TaxID=523841 RepID=I3RBE4_HALMT|nr:cupredoxin domain-containing protein [Haloferax mediterranei]AFK21554.1 Copper binding protein, plastocyanin/azurin family [Haloferax mediterranei ATCC 33500]AHZ24396.1 copper-binding protein [Haloferax mediterranei ATCC 33500]MDX5990120.1 cupredoxin domain-containing protein [Haloferax mediterranei ATCC 33500]QCQ76796.1 copper-binding protein [Haloferax mediterranei ATCC 33500]